MKSPVSWLTDEEYAGATRKERAVAWADSFNGEREVGFNGGAFVANILRAVGLPIGHAWCAAFVSYVFKMAGIKTGPEFNRARVKSWADWAGEKGLIHYRDPKRGDLFFYLNEDGKGHIGFVLSEPDFDGAFRTVEGNTSLSGSREGDGVYKRVRHTGGRVQFIRWWA